MKKAVFFAAGVSLGALAVACQESTPQAEPTHPPPTSMVVNAAPPAAASSSAPEPVTSADAWAPPAASSSAAPAASSAPPHVVDMLNKSKPDLESADLTTRANHLFTAVQKDDPEIARDFFFPREPFTPLKDVAKPDGYWKQLYRAYENDIHNLHKKQPQIEGAEFVSFTLGSPPGWVPPGDEANKIGYFRTFNGKVRYRATDGKTYTIEAKTIISWDGGWYVTHLSPFKQH